MIGFEAKPPAGVQMTRRVERWFLGIVRRVRREGEEGQSTTEYALVILVAATIALLLLNWVKGGAIVGLFQSIFDKVVAMFD